ncbi:MAG: hypothetical protein E4H14_15395 [Candidatus Thorarchaeota archaeon]|nr:MAG: hypothetical protein E4H14_15395 [Candidatus Thorarchaeota archaeon]
MDRPRFELGTSSMPCFNEHKMIYSIKRISYFEGLYLKRTFTLAILVAILLTPNIPYDVSANPVSMDYATSVYFFSFASNISMPEASVNITLICRDVIPTKSSGPTFIYDVEMRSSFLIESDDDQNATIAFVYPSTWQYSDQHVLLPEIEFKVIVDDIEVPTLTVTLSETNFSIDDLSPEDQVDWGFLEDNELVLFNVTHLAHSAATVKVNTDIKVNSATDIFTFDYCVGTARAWNGSTTEEVRIQLYNTSLYKGNWFIHDNSLTVTQGSDMITGFWYLNSDSFSGNYVGVSITQKQWPYTTTTTTTTTTSNQTDTQTDQLAQTVSIVLAISACVSVIVIVIVVFSKRT